MEIGRWPNPAHALDGGIPFLFHVGRHWPAASDTHRSANRVRTIDGSTGLGYCCWKP
jgi:hypothetical protein